MVAQKDRNEHQSEPKKCCSSANALTQSDDIKMAKPTETIVKL